MLPRPFTTAPVVGVVEFENESATATCADVPGLVGAPRPGAGCHDSCGTSRAAPLLYMLLMRRPKIPWATWRRCGAK